MKGHSILLSTGCCILSALLSTYVLSCAGETLICNSVADACLGPAYDAGQIDARVSALEKQVLQLQKLLQNQQGPVFSTIQGIPRGKEHCHFFISVCIALLI